MPQVKKISVATVYGKIDAKKVLTADAPLPIMRVLGVAVGTKTGTSPYGDWTALIGDFKAINLETGEESRAAQCFLPEIALIPLMTALKGGDGRANVQFGLDLFVKAATNAKPGGVPYEYTFEPVIKPSAEDDPIARLEAQVSADALALPAPKEPAPAPAPAEPAKGGKGGRR